MGCTECVMFWAQRWELVGLVGGLELGLNWIGLGCLVRGRMKDGPVGRALSGAHRVYEKNVGAEPAIGAGIIRRAR